MKKRKRKKRNCSLYKPETNLFKMWDDNAAKMSFIQKRHMYEFICFSCFYK